MIKVPKVVIKNIIKNSNKISKILTSLSNILIKIPIKMLINTNKCKQTKKLVKVPIQNKK